jgi:5-oxoprolinase (ATP-hydrolysing) subunit B
MLRPMAGNVQWIGDRALLRTFDADLPTANRAARECAGAITSLAASEIEDVVPGARSVLVVLRGDGGPSAALTRELERERGGAERAAGREHRIPVHYGGDDGADLAQLARVCGVAQETVIAAHAAPEYTVAFIGFAPGFPYLLGLDERIAVPRLSTPRVRVPAGSVGIGGAWTGVYPRPTPGGWWLIGRTDVELFDPLRQPPNLLLPGDRVRFVPR